jgi:hypothetical protein
MICTYSLAYSRFIAVLLYEYARENNSVSQFHSMAIFNNYKRALIVLDAMWQDSPVPSNHIEAYQA